MPGHGAGVRSGDREHRRAEILPGDARAPNRLIRGLQQRLHRPLRADRVLIARAGVPEVKRLALQVEHRGERLRRAAVDPHHEAGVRAGLGICQRMGQLDERLTVLHAPILAVPRTG